MQSNSMDDRCTQALKENLDGSSNVQVRQTRRGWFSDCCCGCEERTEFKYFTTKQFGRSVEESDCCCRFWCKPNHDFRMTIREQGTNAEVLTVDRPCRFGVSACKCCCYQQMTVTSGGRKLGRIEEECWYCVPSFVVVNHRYELQYKIHPPTCCGGACIDCCGEDGCCCCGRGCCIIPFHIFPPDQYRTDNGAPNIGKIVKVPEAVAIEVFTDADAFEMEFPTGANLQQKGLLLGASIFLNALFFEGEAKECGYVREYER